MIKKLLTLLRVLFLIVVFFVLGVFLVVLLLQNWSSDSQALAAVVFAIAMTWWIERKIKKRSLSKFKNPREKNQKTKKAKKAQVNKTEKSAKIQRQDTVSPKLRDRSPKVTKDNPFNNESHVDQNSGKISKEPTREIKGKQSGTSLFRKNNTSAWVAANESAKVAGRDIGGMIYVGTPPRPSGGAYQDACKAYIDPSLPVDKVGRDVSGDDMPYWPGYTTISPKCRATYLDWLATGRSNTAYSPGYMFLFFYGLERRFFIGEPNADADNIVHEVARLRNLYPKNRSVQRYLGEFLDVAELTENNLANIKPVIDSQRWEVPFSIKYAIGAKLSKNENLSGAWLLAWFVSHPESSLRTPAERCKEEFEALFKIHFNSRFPHDLKVNKPRKQLRAEYRAASGEFQVKLDPTVDGKSIPDISGLRKPIEIAQEIADETMNDLDKLSRYLGRTEQGRGSLEAHALLPQELWSRFPNESFSQLTTWAESIVKAGGLVPVAEVVERLEGDQPIKLTKRKLTGAADALARIGFGLAPDPRFALRSPKLEEPVVLFELGEPVEKLEDVSAQYRIALVETAVSSFVAHADGRVNEKERTSLLEKVRNAAGLTLQEQRRLEANLNWMLVVSPDLSLIRRKLKESDPETISSLRTALVSTAHADGIVQSEEVVTIEKLYKTLGLDPGAVYSDLHAGDVPVRVRAAEPDAPGEAIPAEPQYSIPKLDASRIAAIRSDTERVSSVLGAIFSEEPASDSEEQSKPSLLDGLDAQHTQLVQILVCKETWSEDEVRNLCKELGLMVSGAIETINEWSFEVYDEGLIDEYEGFEIAADPAEVLKKKLVMEL